MEGVNSVAWWLELWVQILPRTLTSCVTQANNLPEGRFLLYNIRVLTLTRVLEIPFSVFWGQKALGHTPGKVLAALFRGCFPGLSKDAPKASGEWVRL